VSSPEPPHPFKIVDLFAGPGGLDSAARDLQIPTIGIEWDPNACATRRAEDLETQERDVRDLSPDDFDDANVLVGGPPCQTFTVAGHGAGRKALDQVLAFAHRLAAPKNRKNLEPVRAELKALSDVRTGLVLEPLRWILQALADGRPYEAVVLEQVPTVLPVWQAFGGILQDNGYTVAHPAVLHTEQYGVPQTRRRAILIARRQDSELWRGKRLELPKPTHRRYRKGVAGREAGSGAPWITMGEALRNHRRGEFIVISNYGTGGDPKARGRRRWDEPSATVTGKVSRNRVIGIDGRELPRFSLNEAGLLQTFRDGYNWRGGDISQQIGNAVPPRLGMHILAAALDLPHALAQALQRQNSAG
jgi:DNA (cytosine-5)-methyltransferase 1